MTEQLFNTKAKESWRKLGISNRHGIALPLSALRTRDNCGIGEFYDLLPLISWCKNIGFSVIQLLPLNDSHLDPSPYNAISSCALNPLFLSLHALPKYDASPSLRKQLSDFRQLSQTKQVDYLKVFNQKIAWLKEYWETIKPITPEEIDQFTTENPWAKPYASFKTLKEQYPYLPWWEWKTDNSENRDVQFFIALQILCYRQLKFVADFARKQNVHLMGDIPILVSRDSADVWKNQQFFDLSFAAGAPPDMYTEEGQYWGFPIYEWDQLKKENYSWWKERLHSAETFYDIYRIDHIVGFYRIWAIPIGKKAKEGFFIPKKESEWIPHGELILKTMLESSGMVPIGEDLGTVPSEVRENLSRLGICGTKVMRWEREWKGDQSFIPTQKYSKLSLTCVSTQDTETLTLWWRNQPKEAERYAIQKGWKYRIDLSLEQRVAILKESHSSGSLFHINPLQEYLACYEELCWENPEDERINIPGKVLPRNWTYRFRPTLEEIINHSGLKKTLQSLLSIEYIN